MFTPAIYITHRILRQIVDIELANQQYLNDLKHFIPKYNKTYLVKLLCLSQRNFSSTIHSELSITDFINDKKEIEQLRSLKNAIQSINSYETSLRAEDDWNLLIRINHLINKERLASQQSSFRTTAKIKEKEIFDLYQFENNDQLEHFVLELLRWYRTSDKEINGIIRVLTVLYHLMKTFPFLNSNFETIAVVEAFFIRENNLELLNTINFVEFLITIKDKKIELNDFINKSLDYIISEKNKFFYELEKQNLENTAPKKMLNLNRRQIELLKVMQARDKINRREASDLLEVSFMTAYRDIKGLLKKKLLVERGVGRGTYYILASK